MKNLLGLLKQNETKNQKGPASDRVDDLKCTDTSCEVYVPKHGNIFHPDNNLLEVLSKLDFG